ncbi:hypothetical protein DL95DRAFT_497636 [Leptodontidium sp. 2 PMI_412]|nr:hypothetical protein DL95DRAFT_497636 [Leptodontidium sp. 2 PMI_412]
MATSQNEALLVAVFRQLAVTKLDYGILGKDLGLSREAARNRWVRFQAKIMKSANSSNDADTGTGQPKKTSTSMGKTGSMKERKRASSEDNVELGLDLSTGIERELGL